MAGSSSNHLIALIERFRLIRQKIEREARDPASSPLRLLRLQRLAMTIRQRLARAIRDKVRHRKNLHFAVPAAGRAA
jgi:hypothetical protein